MCAFMMLKMAHYICVEESEWVSLFYHRLIGVQCASVYVCWLAVEAAFSSVSLCECACIT